MIYEVTTTAGSVYVIDTTAKTWQRTPGDASGDVRTTQGVFWDVFIPTPPDGRSPMVISGPPVDPAMDMRVITTSIVLTVREAEQSLEDYLAWPENT